MLWTFLWSEIHLFALDFDSTSLEKVYPIIRPRANISKRTLVLTVSESLHFLRISLSLYWYRRECNFASIVGERYLSDEHHRVIKIQLAHLYWCSVNVMVIDVVMFQILLDLTLEQSFGIFHL